MAIEAEHYETTRQALMADPIIRAMADEIPAGTDTTAWEFTSAALTTYAARGGNILCHIGGPAEAIRRLRNE